MTAGREPDVLMDPVTGDLPISTQIVAGQDITAQRVQCRFETHFGDWPLDNTVGVRWGDHLGKKPRDLESLASVLAIEAAGVPGVSTVENLTWADGPAIGDATISMTVRTIYGDRIPIVISPQGVDGNPSIVVGGLLAASGRVVP